MTPATRTLTELPDEDLMVLVANGIVEQPATELFRRHNRALFNFIAWQCQGNTHEAEDITQKTWVKLMTRCADYRPEAAFRTYLFQIARNTLIDQRKSAAEQRREDLDESHLEIPAEDMSPEQELRLRQNLNLVRQALLSLPQAQREVVVLRFFSEMSLEEIAHTVGEGFETVKSRLRYAFTRLRRELEALG
ncbi:sigma-70 family RNA polymerase sigma factor [Uliginosibacterium gangwonense]|uniref:sigma-70 family RNA polymerase sigma factor n=1 Tax=Uliginosibacterium gangwonense TaxID=392736 RepID=UPI000362C45E|nr:sigma-70 family RNA polymerase sigma factor [Uliginosibacterium gangwonense]